MSLSRTSALAPSNAASLRRLLPLALRGHRMPRASLSRRRVPRDHHRQRGCERPSMPTGSVREDERGSGAGWGAGGLSHRSGGNAWKSHTENGALFRDSPIASNSFRLASGRAGASARMRETAYWTARWRRGTLLPGPVPEPLRLWGILLAVLARPKCGQTYRILLCNHGLSGASLLSARFCRPLRRSERLASAKSARAATILLPNGSRRSPRLRPLRSTDEEESQP